MELRLATPEQLETVYDADLKVSFPAAELKPLRIIQRMLEDGYYRPWCLFDGAEIVGECFLWLGEPGWALLDYLCISPRCRNGGLGALLLEKMLEAEPGVVILGESEMPEYAPDPAMAQRRLGFYARNHARLAGYDHGDVRRAVQNTLLGRCAHLRSAADRSAPGHLSQAVFTGEICTVCADSPGAQCKAAAPGGLE